MIVVEYRIDLKSPNRQFSEEREKIIRLGKILQKPLKYNVMLCIHICIYRKASREIPDL